MSSGDNKHKQWVPLESDPALLNKYLRTLGANPSLNVVEVFGTDPELLAFVPQPVEAVMLLYPLNDASENQRESQAKALRATAGAPADCTGDEGEFVPKGVYWTRQTVSNACGTVALVHTVANLAKQFPPVEGSFFANFLSRTADMTPGARASALEDDDTIETEHQALAAEASSDVDHAVNDNLHFVTLIPIGGRLYELDGRKVGPIDLGPCAPEELLTKAAEHLTALSEMMPGDLRFSLCAISSGEVE